MSLYQIEARYCPRHSKDAYPWQLWNAAAPAPAGSRLIKGTAKFPLKINPLSIDQPWEPGWNRYGDEFEAGDAAGLLQSYLDDYEDPKAVKQKAAELKAAEREKQSALF